MHELEALERRGWEALAGPRAGEFYDDVMADDGLMVFPALVLDKPGSLRAMASAAPWSSFRLSDVTIVTPTPDVGIVTYRASARRPGEDPYAAYMTTVYVKSKAGWRLVLHQQSPAPKRVNESAEQ